MKRTTLLGASIAALLTTSFAAAPIVYVGSVQAAPAKPPTCTPNTSRTGKHGKAQQKWYYLC